MSNFLIISAISMAALLSLYHLLFEREKMHRFNRFYLLAAVAFSLALPFITIEIYTEAIAEPLPLADFSPAVAAGPVPQAPDTDYLPYIGWGIYAIVTLLFIIRFALHIHQIVRKLHLNETVEMDGATLVLLKERVLPHTFFNYVFINNEDYEKRNIEKELFTHEFVHVRQRHSFDILFIEILKTAFWFNPLIYLYKRAIQLNHEFLADENVVHETRDVAAYQQLLLSKAVPATYYPLASSLNFSITKKRFTMMTKSTSKKTALLLKLSVLPIAAGLIALLCTETVAQERPLNGNVPAPLERATQTDDDRRDSYYAGVHVKIHDEWNNVFIDKKYEDLTLSEKRSYLPLVKVFEAKTPSAKEFESWKDKKKFAIWLDDKNIGNEKLNSVSRKDIATYRGSSVFKNARTKQHPQPYQMSLYSKQYFEEHLKPMGEKYKGTLYELTIRKDKKIEGNNPIGAVYAMENLIDDKPQAPARRRDTLRDNAGNMVVADRITRVDNSNVAPQEDEIIPAGGLQVQPEYPGGIQGLYAEVSKKFKLPKLNKDSMLKVFVSFVIEKDGTVSNIKAVRDPGHGLGEEAVRVLNTLDHKWKPGEKDGKAVRTSYNLPITINIKK